jgi:hypothetical protein
MAMALVSFDLKLLFETAVELLLHTIRFPHQELLPPSLSETNTPNSSPEVGEWHRRLDAIEQSSNRLKRCLGATGPLDSHDLRQHPSQPTWQAFLDRFKYVAHSPLVRKAFLKLAFAAIDLNGYCCVQTPIELFRERGLQLLHWGIVQLWEGMNPLERNQVRSCFSQTIQAMGWPADRSSDPPPYDGPDDIPSDETYRVIDTDGGFRTRTVDFLWEIQHPLAYSLPVPSDPNTTPNPLRNKTEIPSPLPVRPFLADEIILAAKAFDQILQAFPLTSEGTAFRQSTLLQLLGEKGITRSLGLALIEQLIQKCVFLVIQKFFKAQFFTAFAGEQTDCIIRDRYLLFVSVGWAHYWYAQDPQMQAWEELERLRQLQQLARDGLNAMHAIRSLPYMLNWETAGRRSIEKLYRVVTACDPEKNQPDPFCREELVHHGEMVATSGCWLAFELVRQTWKQVQLTTLVSRGSQKGLGNNGEELIRFCNEQVKQSPLEVPWTKEVWLSICQQIRELPSISAEWFESVLTQELILASRRLAEQTGCKNLPIPGTVDPPAEEDPPILGVCFEAIFRPEPTDPPGGEANHPVDESPDEAVLRIHEELFQIQWGNCQCSLGNTKEFALFRLLYQKKGKYVSLQTIQTIVWNDDKVEKNSIQKLVSELRKKLRATGFNSIEIDGSQRDHYVLRILSSK